MKECLSDYEQLVVYFSQHEWKVSKLCREYREDIVRNNTYTNKLRINIVFSKSKLHNINNCLKKYFPSYYNQPITTWSLYLER